MAGIRPYMHPRGGHGEFRFAPLAATQTYDIWDPVYLVAGALTECVAAAVIEDAEFVGFAAEPATGYLAGSRLTTGMNFTGRDGAGAITNTLRTFIAPYRGQLFATTNFWTDLNGTTLDVIGGADMGSVVSMTTAAAGDWGLVDDATATVADEAAFRIITILDINGIPFNATTADATSGTMATQIIFEVANLAELDQVSGG